MIVKATNKQAHLLATVGVKFIMLFQGCYLLDGSTTMGQLEHVGLTVRGVK